MKLGYARVSTQEQSLEQGAFLILRDRYLLM